MAIEGEQADPRIPAPAELRPILSFRRLSTAANGVIARVIEDDGMFRARVAEAADEDEIGRAGWLWLHRPVDWALDPVFGGSPAPATGAKREDKRDDKAAVARLRKAAAEADVARKRAAQQLGEVRRTEAEVRADRDRLAAQIESLNHERSAAIRRSKEVEAQLAAVRRDLKVAREATREAEAELREVRGKPAPARAKPMPEIPAESKPEPVAAPTAISPEVAASVRAAAAAATDLASALADAALALGPTDAAPARAPVPASVQPRSAAKGQPKKRKDRRSDRAAPSLPPGVFDGTPEAHRHLITTKANLLVVDGYNVARAAWSSISVEEERRRTVAVLEDVQARSGGKVVVVFDGDTSVSAPKASKNVRVRFSATGETADDHIVQLLAATPLEQPVVVVSSDRAVAADARRQGAVAIGAKAFLQAAGR